MKTNRLALALALATTLCLAQPPVSSSTSSGGAPPPAPAGERRPPERHELKVLKVYAAQDGEARFRAYVVKWKDQEVVVSDSLSRTDYREGDTITVLAMNHPFPQGAQPHRLLAFTVVPERR